MDSVDADADRKVVAEPEAPGYESGPTVPEVYLEDSPVGKLVVVADGVLLVLVFGRWGTVEVEVSHICGMGA